MKSITALLIFFLGANVFANDCFQIENRNGNEYLISLTAGNFSVSEATDQYGKYNKIETDEDFKVINGTGLPILPKKTFTLSGEFNVDIMDEEYDTIQNVTIRPADRPLMIGPDYYDVQKELIYSDVYSVNDYWPSKGIISQEYGIFRSVPITSFNITPFKYNPVTKKLIAAKKLKIKLINKGAPVRKNALQNPVLSNVLTGGDANRVQAGTIEENGRAGKLLVFTIDSLLPAVEKLVRWQKMKGYDVVVESKAGQYPKSEVIAKIDSELIQSDAVSKYVLMFGNTKAVEEYEVKWFYFNNLGNVQGVSMSRYGDAEGDDHLPEVARGIVPANNMEEAMICVDKFIKYETDPVMDADFYNNILGAAQSGFSHKPVEKIMDYMDGKGYTTTPRYYFNDDQLAMVDRMNNGCIISAQYDHGYRGGWATPEFTGNQINTMTNGDKLSYMFSINCLSGSFDYANGMDKWNPKPTYEPGFYGLTERFLFKENAGGIGAFGATNITYTGINDTLLFALFKAIWPEDDSRIPLYRTGDFADYSLFYMHENNGGHGGNQSIPDFCDYHYMLYHNMCDPTLQIRTKLPTVVTVTLDPNIAGDATSFSGSSVNIGEGTAVVYNEESGEVVGRAKVNSGSFNMSLDSDSFGKGDTLTIAINGNNCVPYIKTIVAGEETSINNNKIFKSSDIKMFKNGFNINNNGVEPIEMQLCNLQGKIIKSEKITAGKKVVFNHKNLNIANGTFFVRVKSTEGVKTSKFVFTSDL